MPAAKPTPKPRKPRPPRRPCARPACRRKLPAEAHANRRYCDECQRRARRKGTARPDPPPAEPTAETADAEPKPPPAHVARVVEELRRADADPLLIAAAEAAAQGQTGRLLLDAAKLHLASKAGEGRRGAPSLPPLPQAALDYLRRDG